MRPESHPGYFDGRLDGIALDVGELRGREARVFFRFAIEHQPKREPNESQRTGENAVASLNYELSSTSMTFDLAQMSQSAGIVGVLAV